MSTQVQQPAGAKQGSGETVPAIVFELESTASGGRKAAFEVIKEVLGGDGARLSHAVFAKIGCQSSPRYYLDALVETLGSKSAAGDIKDAVQRKLSNRLAAEGAALNSGLEHLITEAIRQGSKVGVLTALPDDAAQEIFDRLGLGAKGAQLFAGVAHDEHFPGADTWLKVAKGLGRSSRHCIAVVDCNFSCKTALSAGMRCLAVPDEFTGYQDFGGADLILDTWDDVSAKEILTALTPVGV